MNGTWLTLITVGVATFAYRISCIELGAGAGSKTLQASSRFGRMLRFVPPAAFAAIVSPAIVLRDGALLSNALDPRLIATAAALIAALVTRSVLATLVSGMIVLHAVRLLL